jgi:hypothetical protein
MCNRQGKESVFTQTDMQKEWILLSGFKNRKW